MTMYYYYNNYKPELEVKLFLSGNKTIKVWNLLKNDKHKTSGCYFVLFAIKMV